MYILCMYILYIIYIYIYKYIYIYIIYYNYNKGMNRSALLRQVVDVL